MCSQAALLLLLLLIGGKTGTDVLRHQRHFFFTGFKKNTEKWKVPIVTKQPSFSISTWHFTPAPTEFLLALQSQPPTPPKNPAYPLTKYSLITLLSLSTSCDWLQKPFVSPEPIGAYRTSSSIAHSGPFMLNHKNSRICNTMPAVQQHFNVFLSSLALMSVTEGVDVGCTFEGRQIFLGMRTIKCIINYCGCGSVPPQNCCFSSSPRHWNKFHWYLLF